MGYIALMIAIILIVLMSGCGARKVETSINKTTDKYSDKMTSEGVVSKTNSSVDSSSLVSKINKGDESKESRVTELFNENGTLKQRITELLNRKSFDTSQFVQKSVKTLYINTDSTFNNTHYITRDINHYIKDKKSDANNNSLYLMLFGLGVFAIVAVFVYRYVTRVKVPKAE
ncbi:hypothetical protein [uncultured Clostridium sp.]|uniref:hypothetical protein n=1 Tax=uncultured Clostridium sp. TaxID=59620 RepID=UPI002635672C|nr:hypothetical protein [uncultured Clostridium sp.]